MKRPISWLIILLLISVSCVNALQGVCRHESLYAVSVFGEKYPVRIAIGRAGSGTHAQAQALIDGEWQWLRVKWPDVYVSARDEFIPDSYIKGEAAYIYFGSLVAQGKKKQTN